MVDLRERSYDRYLEHKKAIEKTFPSLELVEKKNKVI